MEKDYWKKAAYKILVKLTTSVILANIVKIVNTMTANSEVKFTRKKTAIALHF